MINDDEWRQQAIAVGKRIRELRSHSIDPATGKDLRQQRVADALGCWIKAYQDAENGDQWGSRGPGIRLMFKIAEFYGVDIKWLWYGVPPGASQDAVTGEPEREPRSRDQVSVELDG